MVQDFWKREWIQEWLPSIFPIHKYNKEQRDSREGAIALVASLKTPQRKWLLGRLLKLFTGSDGHFRLLKLVQTNLDNLPEFDEH